MPADHLYLVGFAELAAVVKIRTGTRANVQVIAYYLGNVRKRRGTGVTGAARLSKAGGYYNCKNDKTQ